MGGEEIVTAESFGNRIVTYIRAAGTTIATHSSGITWMHKDLNMNSMRSTREDGTLIEQEGGSDLGKHELDPAGNSVGFSDPYTVSYPDPFPYFFQPFESFCSLVNGQFQSYSVDGIQVPRSYLLVQTEFTFGGIFGLVEHQSRMSYFEWLRNLTTPDGPDLPGPDGILGTNDDTVQVGSSTGWYRKDASWALNLSLVPFEDRYAQLDSEDPLTSFLAFQQTAVDSGRLTVGDLLSVRLKPNNLAFLASCDTSKVHTGEGLISIPWALLGSGSSSVVSSQWEASDKAAQAFSTAFYREYLDGRSTADALQNAAVSIIRNKSAGFHEPYYWAAFTLLGDFR